MKFNLKQYIKENYLNEKLQSDIFIHEILEDDLFKFYKVNNPGTTYNKLFTLYENNILPIIQALMQYNRYHALFYDKQKLTTDEEYKALYNKYMSLTDSFFKTLKILFKKPEPQLFKSLIINLYTYQNTVDLYNITDDQFIKYKYSDFQNKSIQTDLDKYASYYLCFYFSADKKIKAISKDGYIILYSFDNSYNNLNYKLDQYNNNIKDYEKFLTDKNNYILKQTQNITLSNGEILKFPILDNELFNNIKYDFIFKRSKLNQVKLNKIYRKSSAIFKTTDWGKSPDDYMLIYNPLQSYKKDGNNISSVGSSRIYTNSYKGYNDCMANRDFVERKTQQKEDYQEQRVKIYKWAKTILGKFIPYNQSNDEYCKRISAENNAKYKLLVSQLKSVIKLKEYKEELKTYFQKLSDYISLQKDYNNKIKSYLKEDINKFKLLMFLYSNYLNSINNVISKYGEIQKIIIKYKDLYKIKNIVSADKENNETTRYTIESTNKTIKGELTLLNNLLDNVQKIKEKLDEQL